MISNYISHLNGFRTRRKAAPLTANELALYFVIMEYCNEIGWKEWFTAANGVLQGLAGLSRSAFHRARDSLKELGYIDYKDGTGNQAGKYLLVDFGTQAGTLLELKPGHSAGSSPGRNPGPLNKLNKTKRNIASRRENGSGSSYDLDEIENMINTQEVI